jgi:hypothetical protein
MRNLILVIAVIGLCSALIGCQDEASETADELGVQKGRRPVPEETRAPPGPPQPELVTEDEVPADQDDDS